MSVTILYQAHPPHPSAAVAEGEDLWVPTSELPVASGWELRPEGAKRVHPGENRIELNDGASLDYDYLIVATGPDLAFDDLVGQEQIGDALCFLLGVWVA